MASNKITATAWSYLKTNYPEELEKMAKIEVSVNRFNLALKRIRRRKSKTPRKKKTEVQRYGEELAGILGWLDCNCEGQYYPTFRTEKYSDQHKMEKIVEVYFMEETDAMAFKLVFE